MTPSTAVSNPNPALKSESESIKHPSTVIDASSAALSTAAAVAAITSNCPIQRAPPIIATMPSANVPCRLQQNTLVSAKGVASQVFPHQPHSNNINVPQHHLVMNLVHPQVYPMPSKYTTPSVFTNMKLRRGKWTPEEERFANALIKEFEKGTIHDCENGCTLRAFLSRKLHCAPMRISKKYAGKSIGKHVFLSRHSATTHSHQSMQLHIHTLRQLEFQFHVSLFQEGSPGMEHDNTKLGHALFSGNEFNQIVAGFPMAFRPNLLTNEVGSAMTTMTTINTPNQCQGLPNQPAVFQWPVAAVPQPDHPGNLSPWQNSSVQLQPGLFTGFKGSHQSSVTSSLSQPTPILTHVQGGKETKSLALSEEKDSSIVPDSQLKPESNVIPNVGANARHPMCNPNYGIKETNQAIICGSQLSEAGKQTALHPTIETSQLKEVRDFNGISVDITTGPLTYDLNADGKIDYQETREHTLNLLSSKNEVSQNSLNGICDIKMENKATLYNTEIMDDGNNNTDSYDLTADAYALFAQQSAMAVSKHSAYCMNETNISTSEAESTALHTKKIETKSINSAKDNVIKPENSAAFNATNLQIHFREAEEKARVSQTSKNNRHTTCDSTKHNSINIGEDARHVNLVSGSERSSDMSADGAEGSTSVSCSGSGSDNASEDSRSDDVNTSGEGQKVTLLREDEENYGIDHDLEKSSPDMKRQKVAVMVMGN